MVDPPQPKIEPKGTVSFRINLEQPDAHASRFEVTFTAPKKGGGKDAGASSAAKPAESAK